MYLFHIYKIIPSIFTAVIDIVMMSELYYYKLPTPKNSLKKPIYITYKNLRKAKLPD